MFTAGGPDGTGGYVIKGACVGGCGCGGIHCKGRLPRGAVGRLADGIHDFIESVSTPPQEGSRTRPANRPPPVATPVHAEGEELDEQEEERFNPWVRDEAEDEDEDAGASEDMDTDDEGEVDLHDDAHLLPQGKRKPRRHAGHPETDRTEEEADRMAAERYAQRTLPVVEELGELLAPTLDALGLLARRWDLVARRPRPRPNRIRKMQLGLARVSHF